MVDYSDLSNIKTAKQKKADAQNVVIGEDIKKIDAVLEAPSETDAKSLHILLDGKYNAYIPNWGHSTYGYCDEFGYDYEMMGMDTLIHNLLVMKAMLEGYLSGLPVISHMAQDNSVNVQVSNNNQISITISYDEARKKIEDMPGLTDADTEEIKTKIDDLESISKEDLSKKKKWEKVKPILLFAIDKGADVAITIMGLILQMKLGM